MKFKKSVSMLSAVLIFVSALSGCGAKRKLDKFDASNIKTLSSQTLAENDRLKLDYKYEVKNPNAATGGEVFEISVTDKVTGKVWSSNQGGNGNSENKGSSALDITIQNMETYQPSSASGDVFYEVERDKNGDLVYDDNFELKRTRVLSVSAKKIDNGVELIYYFLKYKIAVPVDFYLAGDSFKISIDASKVAEGDENYRLVSAYPMPNMFRVSDKSEDGYIFLPVGNGALMKTQDTADLEKEYHEGPSNYIALETDGIINLPETARMPVFGLKEDNNALFCIAEKSPGAMGIDASTGSRSSDYAKVKPNLFFVDYDYTLGRSKTSGYIRQLSDRTDKVITIGCYFLENEDADYMGMADCYRNYLNKEGFIQKSDFIQSPYSVDILGGVMATTSVAGVPTKKLKTLTTLSSAKEIVSDLLKEISYKPTVCLSGYGETGINYGQIAGGFTISSKLGNKEQIKAIEDYASSNKIPLYFNFEMSKFSESGSGFGYSSDSAKTAVLHSADKYFADIPLGINDLNSEYRILARGKQGKAIEKVLKTTDKFGISGISLSTLGSVAYSDYNKNKVYPLSYKTESENKDYISKIRKSNKAVSGKASAYFAAGLLDSVFDLDIGGNGHFSMDYEIPFYQLVFSDVTPLYTNSVNMADNPEKVIATAAATGMGIGFSLIDEFDVSYMESKAQKLYACCYDANKERIKEYVNKIAEVYDATAASRIVDYKIFDNGLSVTTFENGKVVYVNNSSIAIDTEIGKLESYEFELRGAN